MGTTVTTDPSPSLSTKPMSFRHVFNVLAIPSNIQLWDCLLTILFDRQEHIRVCPRPGSRTLSHSTCHFVCASRRMTPKKHIGRAVYRTISRRVFAARWPQASRMTGQESRRYMVFSFAIGTPSLYRSLALALRPDLILAPSVAPLHT